MHILIQLLLFSLIIFLFTNLKTQMDHSEGYTQSMLIFNQYEDRDSTLKCERINLNQIKNQNSSPQEIQSLKRQKKCIQVKQLNELMEKKSKLMGFLDSIGDYSIQPIRSDVLEHCEKVSVYIHPYLSRQTIVKLVKNRVEKMIKNKRIKRNWSEEDLKILIWIISKYCQFHGIPSAKEGLSQADWNNIAELIPGVTGKSCMFKWLSLKKNNLAQNAWLQEQSILLDNLVRQYGSDDWCFLSQILYIKNQLPNKVYRCPKQCRQHWNCYLNPSLKKGPWSRQQDFILLKAVMELQGIKKWAEIVKLFNGRTENALKNRFNLIVQKQYKDSRNKKKLTQLELITNYIRRNQGYMQLDDRTVQFLQQKKKTIIKNSKQSIQKKQSKKKSKKIQQRDIEQDQYMPQQLANWRTNFQRQKRSVRSATYSKQKKHRQMEQYRRQQHIVMQQNDTKNVKIFEQDDPVVNQNQVSEQNTSQPKKPDTVDQEQLRRSNQKGVKLEQQKQMFFRGQIIQQCSLKVSKGFTIVNTSNPQQIINRLKTDNNCIPCKINQYCQLIKVSMEFPPAQ